jgi:hypothetical protein
LKKEADNIELKTFVEQVNGEIKADGVVPTSNAERKAYDGYLS